MKCPFRKQSITEIGKHRSRLEQQTVQEEYMDCYGEKCMAHRKYAFMESGAIKTTTLCLLVENKEGKK